MTGECPVAGWGHARFIGGSNGVLVVGDFLDDADASAHEPFSKFSRAGAVLDRAIRRAGATREQFGLAVAVPLSPSLKAGQKVAKIEPNQVGPAIEWGRPQLDAIIESTKPRVILACGDIALQATTGLCGSKLGVAHLCGYLLPNIKAGGPPVIPCFSPLTLRLGHMNLLGVLLRCIRLAIQVARESRQPILPPHDNPPAGYIMRPIESDAREFLYTATQISGREHQPEKGYLAYDIETNYSTNEEDAEERPDSIRSIQFSLAPDSGIFLPWRPPFIDIAQQLLRLSMPKLSWNGWRFDDTLLVSNGCQIAGTRYDLMWAWHHLQPDLPRGLQFVAAMQGPQVYQPTATWPWPWKHLDKANPQFYGIVDVAVLQWMVNYQ